MRRLTDFKRPERHKYDRAFAALAVGEAVAVPYHTDRSLARSAISTLSNMSVKRFQTWRSKENDQELVITRIDDEPDNARTICPACGRRNHPWKSICEKCHGVIQATVKVDWSNAKVVGAAQDLPQSVSAAPQAIAVEPQPEPSLNELVR